MLTNAELDRLKKAIVKGLDRSDPLLLSAADQMMDAMRQADNMVFAIRDAADRNNAMQDAMNRAIQDMQEQGARDAAARDAAARDAAARDAAARDAAARDAAARDAAARDAARDHAREAAYDRQVADHYERNIAAADRIHEARAMGGRERTSEVLPLGWRLADLHDMPFRALIIARAEALGIRLER